MGSTGSIGTQTLDVIRYHPDKLQVVGLVANRQGDVLKEQAAEFGVERLALCDEDAAKRHGLNGGMDAVLEVALGSGADLAVVSVAGVIGLLPTIEAIKAGIDIALASKEVLVAAGELVMPLVEQQKVTMTPIDSEHSAIFQCLQGYDYRQIDKLLLTASGGPFRGKTRAELEGVTVQQALNHPTWNMGGKITIDSATLMNKGLETIEAKWLFRVDIRDVEVTVHPQSVIHSIVKFKDGSALGQMGWPNMRLPIQYALLYPERPASGLKDWNPVDTPNLTFEKPDEATFPSLRIARDSSLAGGTMPCVMNAANEEAANGFLRGDLNFLAIPSVVEGVMARHEPIAANLENILETDAWARIAARELFKSQTVYV